MFADVGLICISAPIGFVLNPAFSISFSADSPLAQEGSRALRLGGNVRDGETVLGLKVCRAVRELHRLDHRPGGGPIAAILGCGHCAACGDSVCCCFGTGCEPKRHSLKFGRWEQNFDCALAPDLLSTLCNNSRHCSQSRRAPRLYYWSHIVPALFVTYSIQRRRRNALVQKSRPSAANGQLGRDVLAANTKSKERRDDSELKERDESAKR